MTRKKSMPVIAVAIVVDLLRGFFTFFAFLGPVIVATYCSSQVTGMLESWTFGLLSVGTAKLACGTAAAAAGIAAFPVTATFGIIMADAVGFMGWLFIAFILFFSNRRIFKEGGLMLGASLAVGFVPFLNAVPLLSFTLWRVYTVQIRLEEAAYKAWEATMAKARQEEQKRQQVALRARQEQLAEVQAANDEQEAGAEAQAESDKTIPEQYREAA